MTWRSANIIWEREFSFYDTDANYLLFICVLIFNFNFLAISLHWIFNNSLRGMTTDDFGEILFFYFYCSQSLYSAFLINQNMSVNRRVTSKIIAYNSLLCKQGSCHVGFFWHWFSKPVKFFLSRFFYLLIYNIANIFLTWINSS